MKIFKFNNYRSAVISESIIEWFIEFKIIKLIKIKIIKNNKIENN